MAALTISDNLNAGDMSAHEPYLYLTIVLTISFFGGIWGLFMFMDLTKKVCITKVTVL